MKINYEVELVNSAITASIGVIGKDIDATMKRDLNGKPYFSAKHIKGILRERIMQFKNGLGEDSKAFLDKYFGVPGNDFENRDKIRFSNLKLKDSKDVDSTVRYGIRVNRKVKTAEDNSLFNYELIDNKYKYRGDIELRDNVAEKDLKFILASLFHLDYIGGLKSRGIGRVIIKIEGETLQNLDKIVKKLMNNREENLGKLKGYEKYSYKLQFVEPVVLTKRAVGNYVESRTTIQGSVIRGAIINYLMENSSAKLEDLLKIEASSPKENNIKLASSFVTKYACKDGKKAKFDKVIDPDCNELFGEKLERGSLVTFDKVSNEMSVKINEKVNSAKNEMLFNTEFITYRDVFTGDVYLPNVFETGKEYTIYIGKMKSKGFGKAIITFSKVKNNSRNVKKNIEKLNKVIKDKERTYITFDLVADMILPTNMIYNVGEQFANLIELPSEYKFEMNRSFINTSRFSGYNIVNHSRKMDEILILKGSVITYSLDKNSDIDYDFLKNIEENRFGMRTNEGFGEINICMKRED